MKILPVLDLLNGVVVRGVAGNRANYQPIVSCLTEETTAVGVAEAIRDRFGLTDFYVADLDGIQFGRPNWEAYRELVAAGFRMRIDAGISDVKLAREVLDAGAAEVIVGLESCPNPGLLKSLCETCGPDRIIFSLDLKGGRPFGETSGWKSDNPEEIGRQGVEAGVKTLIVLDLSQVGRNAGLSTLPLCARLKALPVQIITGGGVRNSNDLQTLRENKIDGVLIASALHDGRLTEGDLRSEVRGTDGISRVWG